MEKNWEIGGLKLQVRNITRKDLGQVIGLTSSVLCLISFEELQMMFTSDPDCGIGVFLEDDTLISVILLFIHSPNVAYLGLYITSLPYRGRGIGRSLFNYAQNLVGSRVLILDAPVGKDNVYVNSGFRSCNVDINFVQGETDKELLKALELDSSVAVSDIHKEDLDVLFRYDQQISHCDRSKYIDLIVQSPRSISLLARDSSSKEILGYLIIRLDTISSDNGRTYKSLGFYADDTRVATQLLRELLVCHLPKDASFWFEYPSANDEFAMQVFSKVGSVTKVPLANLTKMSKGGRMPNVKWHKVFSIMSYNSFI